MIHTVPVYSPFLANSIAFALMLLLSKKSVKTCVVCHVNVVKTCAMLVFLNVNYRNIIEIHVLVTAPRNAEHILAQLLRSKNILNHELFRKRREYTSVAFYPVSIPRCHLYFCREGGGVKILLS